MARPVGVLEVVHKAGHEKEHQTVAERPELEEEKFERVHAVRALTAIKHALARLEEVNKNVATARKNIDGKHHRGKRSKKTRALIEKALQELLND